MNIETDLDKNLIWLQELYDDSNQKGVDTLHVQLICKCAFLEYCGWLEVNIDRFILSFSPADFNQRISSTFSSKVNRTYGFGSNKFLELFIFVFGINESSIFLNDSICSGLIEQMNSHLSFHSDRNDHAHSYFSLETYQSRRLDEPAILKRKALDFSTLLDKLKERIQTMRG